MAVFLCAACKQEVTEKEHINTTEKNVQTEIKVANDLIHLGRVKRHDFVAVMFKIINTGETSLQIYKVETDCHCTGAEWENEPIARQDSTFIKVNYDSSQYGHFMQKITLHSNAKDSPNLPVFRGE